jgi:hypothetical protein
MLLHQVMRHNPVWLPHRRHGKPLAVDLAEILDSGIDRAVRLDQRGSMM